MTILYVSDSPTVSGAEIVLLGHIDEGTRAGHTPVVFLSAHNSRLIRELERRRVAVVQCDSFSRTPLRTTLNPAALLHFARAIARTARALRDAIRDHHIDVVHSVSYPASLYAALACRATPTAHVWHEHNIKKIHAVNRRIYRWVAKSCEAVIAVSGAVADRLASAGIGRDKLRVIYNGIDLDRFTPDDSRASAIREEFLLGSLAAVGLFGQFLPYKGHGTLIDAAPQILRRHPETKFFFIGALENPPYQQELEARLAAAGLTDRFVFTGWRSDAPHVMRAMDAVVVATLTPEPAALALMETMAVGRPIIASRTGGTPELVSDGETGLLFEPGRADDLAERVCQVLEDGAMAARLGEKGRALVVARFSRRQHFAQIERVYEQAPIARRHSVKPTVGGSRHNEHA